MSKKNRHIGKYLTDKLPEPEIPAEEAWTGMNGMLGPVTVTGAAGASGGKFLSGLKWALGTLSGVAVTGVLVAKLVLAPGSSEKLPPSNRPGIIELKSGEKIDSSYQDSSLFTNVNNIGNVNDIKSENIEAGQSAFIDTNAYIRPKVEKTYLSKAKEPTSRAEEKVSENKRPNAEVKSTPLPLGKSVKNETGNFKTQIARTTAFEPQAFGNKRLAVRSPQLSASTQDHFRSPKNENGFNSRENLVKQSAQTPSPLLNILPVTGTKGNFESKKSDLGHRIAVSLPVKIPATTKKPKKPESKSENFHFGLEWNVNAPFAKTEYLFAGKDSVSKPANLLIPALVIRQAWRSHQLTFTAAARQTYFGNNKTATQVIDSTFGNSSLLYFNYNLIKATGINLSLQYHYRFAGSFSAGGGASYGIFSNALLRQTMRNWADKVWDGPLVIPSGRNEIKQYLKPTQIAVKAGLLFHPGRFQAGFNLILPISNVSRYSGSTIKELNGQVFLRFMLF